MTDDNIAYPEMVYWRDRAIAAESQIKKLLLELNQVKKTAAYILKKCRYDSEGKSVSEMISDIEVIIEDPHEELRNMEDSFV